METPAGTLAESSYLLRRMLSRSATFLAALQTTDRQVALQHIHFKEFDGQEKRPAACIGTERFSYNLVAAGEQHELLDSGGVALYLAIDTPEIYWNDGPNAYLFAMNFFGGCLRDIAALAGADQTIDTDFDQSEMCISQIELLDYSETPRKFWNNPDYGRFWWSFWLINWGSGS